MALFPCSHISPGVHGEGARASFAAISGSLHADHIDDVALEQILSGLAPGAGDHVAAGATITVGHWGSRASEAPDAMTVSTLLCSNSNCRASDLPVFR